MALPVRVHLAIDTATTVGSVALRHGNDPPLARVLDPRKRNAAELFPAIQQLLREAGVKPAELSRVCWSSGPGSFTGLRVAATVARMLAAMVQCDVVGVPTLAAIACHAAASSATCTQDATIAALLDAKRGNAYAAAYRCMPRPMASAAAEGSWKAWQAAAAGLWEVLSPVLVEPGPWLSTLEKPAVAVLGPGAEHWADAATHADAVALPELGVPPRAWAVLALGEHLPALSAAQAAAIVPLYLRPPECEEVYARRRAEAIERRASRTS